MDEATPRNAMGRRAARVAINVLLVLIILALIAAMWLPAYVGVSPDRPDRDEFGLPRPPRRVR